MAEVWTHVVGPDKLFAAQAFGKSLVQHARQMQRAGKTPAEIEIILQNSVLELRSCTGHNGNLPVRFKESIRILVQALKPNADMSKVHEATRKHALQILERRSTTRHTVVVPEPGDTPQDQETSDSSESLRNLQRELKMILQSLRFNPQYKHSKTNPRHLHGLLQRLDDASTRTSMLEKIYNGFHPDGIPQEVPEWLSTPSDDSFADVIKKGTDIQELQILKKILRELRIEGVMSRFDMENIGLQDISCRLEQHESFRLFHRKTLEGMRAQDIQEILDLAKVGELYELGPFDVPAAFHDSLVNAGIIPEDPTFAEHAADFITVNMRILKLAIKEEFIKKTPRGFYVTSEPFLFYKRRSHNERPHQLVDKAYISHNGQAWPYSEYRLQKFVSS